MPTVGIARDPLFAALGRTFTEDEFQDLCFEFGIELDEVVSEPIKVTKTRGGEVAGEEIVYKIEVPANRYDILCLEGMARALNVFMGNSARPEYTLLKPPGKGPYTMTVEPATAQIRPYIVCAVLRNCKFDDRSYNSFLDLQDRLHHNVCRRRTLVAIGTHDLDTVSPPFRYRALPPRDINFIPLAQASTPPRARARPALHPLPPPPTVDLCRGAATCACTGEVVQRRGALCLLQRAVKQLATQKVSADHRRVASVPGGGGQQGSGALAPADHQRPAFAHLSRHQERAHRVHVHRPVQGQDRSQHDRRDVLRVLVE